MLSNGIKLWSKMIKHNEVKLFLGLKAHYYFHSNKFSWDSPSIFKAFGGGGGRLHPL